MFISFHYDKLTTFSFLYFSSIIFSFFHCNIKNYEKGQYRRDRYLEKSGYSRKIKRVDRSLRERLRFVKGRQYAVTQSTICQRVRKIALRIFTSRGTTLTFLQVSLNPLINRDSTLIITFVYISIIFQIVVYRPATCYRVHGSSCYERRSSTIRTCNDTGILHNLQKEKKNNP